MAAGVASTLAVWNIHKWFWNTEYTTRYSSGLIKLKTVFICLR